MNQKYLLLLVLIFGISTLNAQSLKRIKSDAVKASEANDYSKALKYYKTIVVDAEDETTENYYNYAEAAREFRVYKLAEDNYRKVLADTASRSTYRLANFYLASVLKNQARYSEAIDQFNLFLKNNASFVSESYTKKANKEIADCEWAMKMVKEDFDLKHLDSTINTVNSEFSPILLGDELYFSSVRYETNSSHLPEAPLTRIYISKDSKLANQISDDFNEDLKHSAHATFNKDASKIYYTICESVDAVNTRCKIYYREKTGDKWGKRVGLSNQINMDGYTNTQPNIGMDANGNEMLFFVSDRPGDTNDTENDLNIWYSIKDGDDFGEPKCVENFNSAGDDVTPFFDSQARTLYFSSNGRQNIGGFDIYSIRMVSGGWEEVEHLGMPINSSYDDLYYSIEPVEGKAYLSSNREGAVCACSVEDEEDCSWCNDIYEAPPMKVNIKVLTYNKLQYEETFKLTNGDEAKSLEAARLNGVTVVLDETNPDNPGVPDTDEEGNEYDYAGKFNVDYFTKGELTGYIQDDSTFDTNNSRGGALIEIPLFLTPAVNLDALTFNKAPIPQPITGVKVELFEIKEKDPSFEADLGSQQDQNSSKYRYGIDYRKEYMVVGSKTGYSSDTSYINSLTTPLVPSLLLDSLFLCKQPPSIIPLYFYNDEPKRDGNPNNDLTSAWSYERAYKNLAIKEKPSFITELNSEIDSLAAIMQFFEELDQSKAVLDSFINLLLTDRNYLGDRIVTVELQGSASSRAKPAYNKKLSKRRIASIKNYFREKGLLDIYPGQIKFRELAIGEEKSTSQDEGAGFKNSVYYSEPSRERRIEVRWIITGSDVCPPKDLEGTSSNSYD